MPIVNVKEQPSVADMVTIHVEIQISGKELMATANGSGVELMAPVIREIGNAIERARKRA